MHCITVLYNFLDMYLKTDSFWIRETSLFEVHHNLLIAGAIFSGNNDCEMLANEMSKQTCKQE